MSEHQPSPFLSALAGLFRGGTPSESKLSSLFGVAARKFGVPGIAVGIYHEGREVLASYGVTNIDSPEPIDEHTLFLTASVTKTFTATAIMHLVNEGKVSLEAPVKTYVPELTLGDREAAERITILNLLNHTSGLPWRLDADTGEGDDALQQFVERMVDLKETIDVGARASYSQLGFDLLGRVIEEVTGQTYEQAISTLLLEPLALTDSCFTLEEVGLRRFASGHNADDDGKLRVAKQWKYSRAENPGGGLAASSADLLTWAKFHLAAIRNDAVLPAAALKRMQEPTTELVGSSLGKAIGMSWFLSDINGVRTVRHSGSANGQFAELFMVPERNFAVVSLCNGGPNGLQLNDAVVQWTLQKYLRLVDRPPRPLAFDAVRAQEVVGTYENDIQVVTVAIHARHMTISAGIKPDVRAASERELPADYPAANMGFISDGQDDFVVTAGGMKGQRGLFARDDDRQVVGLAIGGREFRRVLPRH
jgi:CubicO group peptidase (beta-lactamase class C family)